ncbi:MAG: apolipoprotein N-acyltransferase [Bacteroidetes bacterium]|nr:apolipoprotein N-acyltransferase [Bacteroidota bacterium]
MQLLRTNSGIIAACLFSGVLLAIAWPAAGFAPLLFIAWIPLFFAEDAVARNPKNYGNHILFFAAYFSFFTFNVLTTWWVKYASLFGAIAAIVCNALFMALIFMAFHKVKRKLGVGYGYLSLILFWVAFEHVHMDWDLSWPWLTLGNGFAAWVQLIQWYEFTGVLGGTIWIFVINILIYQILAGRLFDIAEYKKGKKKLIVLMIILVPVIYSVIRYHTYEEKSNPVNIAVIQPNVDPYNEKFSGMSSQQQLDRILELAKSVCTDSTDYVVAPETALPDGIWEEEIGRHPQTVRLMDFLNKYPNLIWVIGLASNRFYEDSTQRSATARKFTDSPGYYDSYNTALFLDKNGNTQIHHKSKLVPGVEKMPFPAIFKHLDAFAIDLGGMSGSLGVQEVPTVFKDENGLGIAPVVCYESIYGDYLAKYIRQNASLIFIITNDGWWSDSPGYRQHLQYARLRAIECRRSIARSANTGISCFINQRGDILQATSWWQKDAIAATINANSEITLHTRTGDVLGIVAIIGTIGMILFMFVSKRK